MAMTIVMVLVGLVSGLFFAISGFNKLFNKSRHESLLNTLKDNNIPFVKFNEWWVPSVELSAGMAVLADTVVYPLPLYLGELAILGLLTICLVACLTDGKKRIMAWQPINKADVIDDVLYLPEVLHAVLLLIPLMEGL